VRRPASTPMRAALGVQALVRDAQPFHGPAGDQVLCNDLRGVLGTHAAVPDGLRIDHYRGPVLALVQAAGLVDPHARAKAGLFRQLLQACVQLAFSIGCAGGARCIGGTGIVADKYVAFKYGQTGSPLVPFQDSRCAREIGREARGGPAFQMRRRKRRLPGTFQILACQPARICENDSLTMSTDNLLSLKDDMVAFIEGHGMRRLPGYVTEDIPSILWEGKGNPDAWKDFVEMAKHVGAPFVTFSEMTMEREELDALIEEAGEMNFPDEEATELVEAKWLRKYAGMLGYIQLGFVYQGLVFLHETTTEWYERFQTLLEDIEAFQDIVIDDAHPQDEEEE
jgi:hypothetical protein